MKIGGMLDSFKMAFDGEEEDEVFDTFEEAGEHGRKPFSCWHIGSEIPE